MIKQGTPVERPFAKVCVMECRTIIVSGMVQGVGYRYTAWMKARELGVVGYVRNLRDGRVEVVAQGKPDALNKFQSWCRTGPAHAWVKDVAASPGTLGNYPDFSIR